MTELVLKTGRRMLQDLGLRWPRNGVRLLVVGALFALAASDPELRTIVLQAISDAYLQVTVIVAATLALVYVFEKSFRFDLGQAMARARWLQAPISALLGATPGCGGAIIVVTQYTRGLVSFGSVVAVLIATMGDAAFLLLAREPLTGLGIMAMGFVIGTLSGWFIDAIHGPDFMRHKDAETGGPVCAELPEKARDDRPLLARASERLWVWLAAPGAVIGLFVAMQFDTDAVFGSLAEFNPTWWFGALAGVLCLVMWASGRTGNAHVGQSSIDGVSLGTAERVVKDTNFVTSWVVMGFLAYELGVHFAGSGIEHWLQVWAPFVPLVAILIGFIPGCGPQIVVTTLYVAGAIPLSAQLGNAIANDGDALFPAIALAPRAAVLATVYSALPALIVAYTWYALAE
ncbi:MAG: putative manganese transporter [Pseudomonadota bacterium]|nr:putative manganese transporter [Pseudomonadota bacterium]